MRLSAQSILSSVAHQLLSKHTHTNATKKYCNAYTRTTGVLAGSDQPEVRQVLEENVITKVRRLAVTFVTSLFVTPADLLPPQA